MSDNSWIVFSLTFYKVCSPSVGLAFAYMGYLLFRSGVWGNAGDLKANYGDNKLVLKSAAPGTFFALFGTIVIGVTVWKGLDFTNKINPADSPEELAKIEKPKLPDKLPLFKEIPQ